ncbi:MAG TPA: nucleoside triphosphate pyrophosphohydrolase [Woeseiaceae bacterium]
MSAIENLLEVMRRLRDPEQGCPWDREQSFATIAPYTIEEAYEVADAIAREDWSALRDELGDLLFQVVFHARMAEEAGAFDFEAVAEGIAAKMRRRHPHVFGTGEERARGPEPGAWERIKAEERGGDEAAGESALAGVAHALPALKRAQKLGERAARVGFEWPDVEGPRAKVLEELAELEEARRAGPPAQVAEELGDLLFAVVNLARHLDVDAETALAAANRKFEGRFRHMEQAVRSKGQALADLPLETLETYWQAAKQERASRATRPSSGG